MTDDLIAAAKAEIRTFDDHLDRDHPDWLLELARFSATVWERTARQLQQQRDEARRDIEAPRQANAAARQRLAEILGSEQHGLAEMVLLVGERISELAEQNWRLKNNLDAEQFGREHERRELAEVTRRHDKAARERDSLARRLGIRFWQIQTLRAGVAGLARELHERGNELAEGDTPETDLLAAEAFGFAAQLTVLLDQAGGQPDQTAPETGPSSTHSHEDPAPCVPGTAHAQARDLAASHTADLDAAMHSVWLHGKWRWLTSCMSTAEREAAADAVDRHSLALSAFDGEEHTPIERWWHEKADTGVADGGDTPQAHKAAQTVDLMGPLKASLKRAREARDAL